MGTLQFHHPGSPDDWKLSQTLPRHLRPDHRLLNELETTGQNSIPN